MPVSAPAVVTGYAYEMALLTISVTGSRAAAPLKWPVWGTNSVMIKNLRYFPMEGRRDLFDKPFLGCAHGSTLCTGMSMV